MKNSRRTFLSALAALFSCSSKAESKYVINALQGVQQSFATTAATQGTIKFVNISGMTAQMIIAANITNASTFKTVNVGENLSSIGSPGSTISLSARSFIDNTKFLPPTTVPYPAAGTTVTYQLVFFQGTEFKVSKA